MNKLKEELAFDLNRQNDIVHLIAGVDEVGRGCLFGDVVACAIIMDLNHPIEGVLDSKKLTAKRREALYPIILEHAIAVGIGRINPMIIDKINIKEATREAMKVASLNIKNKSKEVLIPDLILVDAETLDLDLPQEKIIKGDDKSYTISCASIVAKVYRDNLCKEWDKVYPGYDLAQNKGYGTKAHREAIQTRGPSSYHRRSFLGKILGEDYGGK